MIRSDRRISMRLMAVLAGACTLALVACSSSSSSSSSASSTTTPSSSASAASKVTLVVYSAQGYDSAMTKAFTKATGIPTPFVARFTGLAGEFRVRVAAYGSDGTLEITAPAGTAGTLPALRPASLGGSGDAGKALRPGDEAVLAIRPTGVRLASLTDGSPHLTGRVADVAFRGRGYEYAIDLPGLGRLAGVFARHRATRGDEVGLRLEPDGCHLFPAGDTGTSAVREYASA